MKCKRLAIALVLSLGMNTPAMGQNAEQDPNVPALGIATDFGDILIENLGIGRTYNLRQLAGTPYKVINRSTSLVNLKIEPTIPEPNMITRKRRNLGVKPIPSVSWITIGQDEFFLPAKETALTDIIITIPDDPSLYGKKFQASIHSKTVGTNFIQVGVWSHLIIGIIGDPKKQAEMEKNRKRGIKKRADFSLLPDKVYIQNAAVGRPINVRKENKRTIKIANTGEEPVTLSIETVRVSDSQLSLQSGFTEGHPNWLKPKSNKIRLDVDEIIDPGWTLNIPNEEKHRGQKYMFVVKVEPKDKDVVGFTFFGQVYVEVEK